MASSSLSVVTLSHLHSGASMKQPHEKLEEFPKVPDGTLRSDSIPMESFAAAAIQNESTPSWKPSTAERRYFGLL